MNSPRTVLARPLGQALLAGALVLWLFTSALASVHPGLHHWLHKDHQAPSHFCLVTVLEHGQADVAGVGQCVVPRPADFPDTALPCESFFVSHDLKLFPERGPPLCS